MTQEQAHSRAAALAHALGINFYVVRNREGLYLPVQLPGEDCEVLATVKPPSGIHDRRMT